jgi:hypothetical protein
MTGSRALEIVSLLGYVLSGLFAYVLARRRFGRNIAFAAGAFVLWFPPLREWAGHPLTDTMGVAAMSLVLTAGSWSLHGRPSRLVLWASSVLALSFTRDTAVIAVVAAVWLALKLRTGRAVALAGTAALAAAPALLLFGAPLRQTMAFTFSDNNIPTDTSWQYIFDHYGTYLRLMINFDFPFRSTPVVTVLLLGLVSLLALQPDSSSRLCRVRRWMLVVTASFLAIGAVLIAPLQLAAFSDPVPAGMVLIAALLPLFFPADGDAVITLLRGGALGAVGYLFLLPQSTELRLPLVVLPFAAMGVARGIFLARVPGEVSTPEPSHAHDVRRVPYRLSPRSFLERS